MLEWGRVILDGSASIYSQDKILMNYFCSLENLSATAFCGGAAAAGVIQA